MLDFITNVIFKTPCPGPGEVVVSSILRSGSGKTTRVGRSKLEACTAAGVLDSVELRAVVDPRGRQSCLCDYPAY